MEKLEAKLGTVQEKFEKVITTGESLIADRQHLLKIVDNFVWAAVTEFPNTMLVRIEAEENKQKDMIKNTTRASY